MNKKYMKIVKLLFIMLLSVIFSLNALNFAVNADINRGIINADKPYKYGNELMYLNDSKAYEIYLAMLNINTDTSVIRVDFDEPIEIDGQNEDEIEANRLKIARDAQIAMDAFLKDFPEIFWLDVSSSSSSAIVSKSRDRYGHEYYSIIGVNLKLKTDAVYVENLNNSYDKLINELNKVVDYSTDFTIYDKLKYYHDYICSNADYQLEGDHIFNLYGAIVEGTCVCQGYAEAFKALCDLSGIPCVLVIGESGIGSDSTNHMWNYCLMDDNKWYAVDVTWDDREKIDYDYFLIGSNTRNINYGLMFSETHRQNGDFSLSGNYSFTYPELHTSEYVYNYIPDPDKIILGDVNFDFKIDSSDALEVLKISARIKDGNAITLSAGDVDFNGILDSADASKILKYIAKIIDSFY